MASTRNPVKTSALIRLGETVQPTLPIVPTFLAAKVTKLGIKKHRGAATAAPDKPTTKRLTKFQVVIPVKPKPTYYGYSAAFPLLFMFSSTMLRDSVF